MMADFGYRTGQNFRALDFAAQLDAIHGWVAQMGKATLKRHEKIAMALGYGPEG